jgi:hypothetical protein
MVLTRIFGPKRNEVTGEWRRLHNEDLYDLHSPIMIRVIKSERIRWAEHVVRMREKKGAYRERDQLENLSVDVRMTLKLIFKKWDGGDMDCINLALDRDRRLL